MVDLILALMIFWLSWFASAASHEDDLRKMCEKTGTAKGLTIEFNCKEMKIKK